ncbi:hypothetical protein GQ55_9G242100 [Panicum hallii var. hallii]|uniref:LOB domain-containing protein n=1 Tax=Panicum hallii var. hallii TaxID=1504633 RepID=A0A2T7C6Y1_9POAL|nr:hypothetical protein GQ55_9G242100 [Panicum hallii var. hallii]
MSTSSNTEADADASPGIRRCAACKNQRRRCSQDCILAPYFPASDPQRYASVQRVFGASNVARMLQDLPIHERGKAADIMAVEAHRRVQDPVYGCAGIVSRLQGEIRAVQCELARTQAQIAVHATAAARARPAVGAAQLNAPAQAALTQQQQDPFQGLDALLVDDYGVDVNLVDDEMNTD